MNIDGYTLTQWPEKSWKKLTADLDRHGIAYHARYEHTGPGGSLHLTHARGRYRYVVESAEPISNAPPPYRLDAWVGQPLTDPYHWDTIHWTTDGAHVWRSNGVVFLWSSENVPPAGSTDPDRRPSVGDIPEPYGYLAASMAAGAPTATVVVRRNAITRVLPLKATVTMHIESDGLFIETETSRLLVPVDVADGVGSMIIDTRYLFPVLSAVDRTASVTVTVIPSDAGLLWIVDGPRNALIAGCRP